MTKFGSWVNFPDWVGIYFVPAGICEGAWVARAGSAGIGWPIMFPDVEPRFELLWHPPRPVRSPLSATSEPALAPKYRTWRRVAEVLGVGVSMSRP